MMVQPADVVTLERELAALRERVTRLERGASAPLEPAPPRWTAPPAPRVSSPPPAPAPAPAPRRPTPTRSLEDRLGGQVLAWVGGAAVLLGIVFFLALAAANGWIGEGLRAALGGAFSLGLVGLGVRLREREGRTEAALAAAGAGLGGLFVTITVATQVYELLPATVGTAFALATGAAAAVLAVRWRAQAIGALGILGALLAPVLAAAPFDGATIALLLVASSAAAALLVWQRWDWLALAAFAVTTPQWAAWLSHAHASGTVVVVLSAFGVLTVVTAIGFELRCRAVALRASSALLLAANAFVLAAGGWLALGGGAGAAAWLAGLAAAHAAVGLGGARLRRVSHEIRMEALVLGVVLADLAFAAAANGPVLTLGWAASVVAFAALGRAASGRPGDRQLVLLGLGGHVALALGHALLVDAPPGAALHGAGAMLSLGLLAAACLTSARLADESARRALDVLGLAVAAYLATLALDPTALAVTWAVEAVALAAIARRTRDEIAGWGAAAHLAGGFIVCVAFLAPPTALAHGLVAPLAAATGLGTVGLACLCCVRIATAEWRTPLLCAAGLALLYLASCAVVTPFQPSAGAVAVGGLGVRQQGQVLLSALWGLCGLGALVAGLSGGLPTLRRAALALLLVTIGKVFLYDLSALESAYRAASFVALGLLLLGGAFAWQRMRPGPQRSAASAR